MSTLPNGETSHSTTPFNVTYIIDNHQTEKCIWADCAMDIRKGIEVWPHCGRPQKI